MLPARFIEGAVPCAPGVADGDIAGAIRSRGRGFLYR